MSQVGHSNGGSILWPGSDPESIPLLSPKSAKSASGLPFAMPDVILATIV
jgi:hypothetical protein